MTPADSPPAPLSSLGEVCDDDAAIVHRELEVQAWRYLAEDKPKLRRGCDLPHFVQDRRHRLGAE